MGIQNCFFIPHMRPVQRLTEDPSVGLYLHLDELVAFARICRQEPIDAEIDDYLSNLKRFAFYLWTQGVRSYRTGSPRN